MGDTPDDGAEAVLALLLRDILVEVVGQVTRNRMFLSRSGIASSGKLLSPVAETVGPETWDSYRGALALLPLKERAVIVLYIEYGLPFEEIARAADLPDRTVARREAASALLRLRNEGEEARGAGGSDAPASSTPDDDLLAELKRDHAAFATGTFIDELQGIRDAFEASRKRAAQVEPAALAPDLPGFRVLEKLGEGSFGVVYRALDEKLDREVAIKVLFNNEAAESDTRRQGRRGFMDEARALACLDHENIVKIYAVIEEKQALVMEYVEGKPLDEIVEESGPFGAGEVVQIGIELARALAAVHSADMVHRDVKTANVVRRRGGKYLLTDFGEGVFLTKSSSAGELVAGTPLFMSPEQVRGEDVDFRSDLYSLGVVLYHLASEAFPYDLKDDGDVDDLFHDITSGKTVPLRDRRSELPDALVRVIEKALAVRPDDRFSSAGEFERSLLDTLLTPRVARGGRFRAWTRWIVAATLLVIVAIWGITFYLSLLPFSVKFWKIIGTESPVQLPHGEPLRRGDKFYVEVSSRRQIYLYVIMKREEDHHILFPTPKASLENPISSGDRHRLPDVPGEAWQLEEDGDAITTFFVVGSLAPYVPLEKALPGRTDSDGKAGPVESTPIRESHDWQPGILREVVADLERHESDTEFGNDVWFIRVSFNSNGADAPDDLHGR